MAMPLPQMIRILRCPRSGTPLRIDGDCLISATGERYPIVGGKPILVRYIESMHITPPDQSIISRNISHFTPWPDLGPDSLILHLGSGDVPARDPRVISVDVIPTPNADLVAEAEALPFETCSLDLVVSGAVFEHVFDPIGSAAEVRRVLKEGGRFYIDTAFLQTYHGFPSHFFNMTPQAIETFILDDFILEDSGVPDSGTILYTITDLFDRFLRHLPAAQRDRLNSMPLEQVLNEIRKDKTRGNPLLHEFGEHLHRAMAASFLVVGRKPPGYDNKHTKDIRSVTIRRNYYAARVAVMNWHFEACYYAMVAKEQGTPQAAHLIPSLPEMLAAGTVADPTDLSQFQEATRILDKSAASLIEVRNHWIKEYLTLSPSGQSR